MLLRYLLEPKSLGVVFFGANQDRVALHRSRPL